MDIFSVFTAGFFIGGFIIVIIMCSFKDYYLQYEKEYIIS